MVEARVSRNGCTSRPGCLADNARYHKPVVITENGIGTQSGQKSIRYFREHIAQIRRAMAEGVDVRGYFRWTPVDTP